MTCEKCGRVHDNAKGTCPFDRVPTRLIKRQRERPSEVLGTVIKCGECGVEITKWKKDKVPYYPSNPNSPCYEDEIPDHVCEPRKAKN